MKNDAKFEEELTCHFKIDLRNLTNFYLLTLICSLIGFFVTKYIMLELKKYGGVMFGGIED